MKRWQNLIPPPHLTLSSRRPLHIVTNFSYFIFSYFVLYLCFIKQNINVIFLLLLNCKYTYRWALCAHPHIYCHSTLPSHPTLPTPSWRWFFFFKYFASLFLLCQWITNIYWIFLQFPTPSLVLLNITPSPTHTQAHTRALTHTHIRTHTRTHT